MASLQEFYQDKENCDNVRAYLLQELEKEAVRRVFEDEEPKVQGLADAKAIIEKAFDHLEELFGPKAQKGRDTSPR